MRRAAFQWIAGNRRRQKERIEQVRHCAEQISKKPAALLGSNGQMHLVQTR
jgi:hypothetical protein